MGLFDFLPDPRDIVCDGWGLTSTTATMNKLRSLKDKMPDRNSLFDHATNKYVIPKKGSVVLCDLSPIPCSSVLGLNVEHTGIYVGNNEIIHRSGEGYLEKVTPKIFLERLNGKNCAISVYVSCHGDESLYIDDSYLRAINALSDINHSGYDILNKNCHHFTRYCLTGDDDQWGLDFTFSSLQELLRKKFGMDNWRIWNY